MKKILFYILILFSMTTFFGYFIYYGIVTSRSISLANEHGDIKELGDVELRINQSIDNYRNIDVVLSSNGYKKKTTSFNTPYQEESVDRSFKRLIRGEELSYLSYNTMENDDYRAVLINPIEDDIFSNGDGRTFKVIIENKNTGKIIRNSEESTKIYKGEYIQNGGAAIVEDKIYAVVLNSYNIGDNGGYSDQRGTLQLIMYELATGDKINEIDINKSDTGKEIYVSKSFVNKESNNIYFLANEVEERGLTSGTNLYKYSVLEDKVEKVSNRRVEPISSSITGSFYYSEISDVLEYGNKLYLIDYENNILCLDKDYNKISDFSLRDILKKYTKLINTPDKELFIHGDKLYFNCIINEDSSNKDSLQGKAIVSVISLKDNSILYYGEVTSKFNHPKEYSQLAWMSMMSRGFHIRY